MAFLGSFFVASLGMYLYITGQSIRIINESDFSSQQPFVNLQFTGSLFAILGWVSKPLQLSYYATYYSYMYVCVAYMYTDSYNGAGKLLRLWTN